MSKHNSLLSILKSVLGKSAKKLPILKDEFSYYLTNVLSRSFTFPPNKAYSCFHLLSGLTFNSPLGFSPNLSRVESIVKLDFCQEFPQKWRSEFEEIFNFGGIALFRSENEGTFGGEKHGPHKVV